MNRSTYNKVFTRCIQASTGVAFILLVFLFYVIFSNGIEGINLQFLTEESKQFGASGGILYQIIGSLLLVFTSVLLSFPIALGTAIYKSEYLKGSVYQNITDILLYVLNGIPSVIFGLFGLIFFVNYLNTGISWFVGSIILAIMMLPTIILSTYRALYRIPENYRENGLGLGLNKWQTIRYILLPQSLKGAITGLLLAMARAIGETAPIMFIATAFSGVSYPTSLFEPISTLPTHILALSQQATNQNALNNAWAASLVLVCLVMLFSISALVIRHCIKS